MKKTGQLIATIAVLLGAWLSPGAIAADLPNLGATSTSAQAQAALKKDAVCTRCHDESEGAPILALYQTKHGVRGDARTPTCQSCHGESDSHVKGAANAKGSPSASARSSTARSVALPVRLSRALPALGAAGPPANTPAAA